MTSETFPEDNSPGLGISCEGGILDGCRGHREHSGYGSKNE